MDRIPKPGECYRHFKNKLYQVITVAVHSETGEKMVVYQALYGTFGTYVRPLSMFLSRVDHEKYPDVQQIYRFEKVTWPEDEGSGEDCGEEKSHGDGKETGEAEETGNLFAFLNAESYREKLEILRKRKTKFTEGELEAVLEALELREQTGTASGRWKAAADYLEMQMRYDGSRLR